MGQATKTYISQGDTPTMKSSIHDVLNVFNVVALPDTLDYLHGGERRVPFAETCIRDRNWPSCEREL